ncbi:MAG TPA: helix-turn-helix domain-containing protein, partial [Sporichthya sp.]|nr:helix-turn-helix domain-containing protein [Sporichthya sp.]
LVTLNAFLQCGRGVRRAADLLGVHPNTVRYRLANVEKLTGLQVTTDDDAYLTAQMAVLVLRLSGRLPLVPLI